MCNMLYIKIIYIYNTPWTWRDYTRASASALHLRPSAMRKCIEDVLKTLKKKHDSCSLLVNRYLSWDCRRRISAVHSTIVYMQIYTIDYVALYSTQHYIMYVGVSEYSETIYDSIEKHSQVSRRRDLGLIKKCWECWFMKLKGNNYAVFVFRKNIL